MPGDSDAKNPVLSKGTFPLKLLPDGTILVPDLAESLIPVLEKLGADPSLWTESPCVATEPALRRTRARRIGLNSEELSVQTDETLWTFHDAPAKIEPGAHDSATLLDVKIELARRLLAPCRLCERRCDADRMHGEKGFCGLGSGLRIGAYADLYNESRDIGAPAFSVFVAGCALRCDYCYRKEFRFPENFTEIPPWELAKLLDDSARRGSRSWHWLGGNPDQSILGILETLRETTESLPVVWNSALVLTPEALSLLRGVVDLWVPDLKFGSDMCARAIARFEGYRDVVFRNLMIIATENRFSVRVPKLTGHEDCCHETIRDFLWRCRIDYHEHPVFS